MKTHNTDHLLTVLVRLVGAMAPGRLKWKEFHEFSQAEGQFGSCFEAIDEVTNVHYSVNLFTGIVLTDGHAPGGLPSVIREHKSFQSLCGLLNFKVRTSNGVLEVNESITIVCTTLHSKVKSCLSKKWRQTLQVALI